MKKECMNSLNKGPNVRFARSVFVKGAVGADPMTKGDVDVNDQIFF